MASDNAKTTQAAEKPVMVKRVKTPTEIAPAVMALQIAGPVKITA